MSELLPLVWLDADGVIGALPKEGDEFSYTQYQTYVVPCRGELFYFLFRPAVIAALNAASNTVEIRWHTMWGDAAQNELAPEIGLKEFTVSNPNPTGGGIPSRGAFSLTWWKVQAIREEASLNPGRPMMWLDDNISADLHQHLNESENGAPDSLSWIQPRPARGLDRLDLAAFAQWVADPSATIRIRRS